MGVGAAVGVVGMRVGAAVGCSVGVAVGTLLDARMVFRLGNVTLPQPVVGSQPAAATKPDGSQLFTQATALSLLVFFALCCQCASTLVVIWKETQSLFWALMTFVYMTGLAYCMAFIVYQISRSLGM